MKLTMLVYLSQSICIIHMYNIISDLYSSVAVLYTPEHEHFGIVPVEAMQLGTPVIAVSSGM